MTHAPGADRPDELARAVALLREGRSVAFPTETVYGLGADARSAEAVRAVFRLKNRPPANPLIVHVADDAMARTVVAEWPARAQILADRFWPGPLTIVLRAAPGVPREVTGGGDTVALRCPDHPVALALLRAFGGPLVGPSANPSGSLSPTCARHVRDAFEDREVMVLDGGACRVGIESTVVSLAHDPARVLRAGAIGADELADALGETLDSDADAADRAEGSALASPGRLASHYAPDAPATLLGREELARELERAGDSLVVLAHEGVDAPAREGVALLVMPVDAHQYAHRLYAALHEADELSPERILIELPTARGPLWDAIRDRLRRACAPRG